MLVKGKREESQPYQAMRSLHAKMNAILYQCVCYCIHVHYAYDCRPFCLLPSEQLPTRKPEPPSSPVS